MATTSMAAGLCALFDTALSTGRCWIVGEQVARLGGAGGVFAGLAERYPARVLDLPIAERANLGFAVGIALTGQQVILEITSTGRMWAVLELLAEAAAMHRGGEFSVPLVIRVPAGGQAGDRIDAPVAEALAAIDGLTVLCPSTPAQALGAWNAALAARAPVVVLEPRSLSTRRAGPADSVAVGVCRTVQAGDDVVLVSWGSGVQACEQAALTLAAEGYEAAVLDLVSLCPIDAAGLGEALRRTGRMVLVQSPEGGLSDRVMRAALDQAFLFLEAPLATAPAHPSQIADVTRATVTY